MGTKEKEKDKKRISISVNEELANALKILADGEGTSISELIGKIISNNKDIKMTINAQRSDTSSGVYAVPGRHHNGILRKDKKNR